MNGLTDDPSAPLLVVGYGSELRGDDAVGQRVAEQVGGWGMPLVRAIAQHQLTPELAQPLAGARMAIFVDAAVGNDGERVQVRSIAPATMDGGLGHTGD